ncbi:hypothetical protein Avbf_12695 [Armadillidium vulgare]|nr:hypothetical protein Avbf_12695 [Armadillidium vulgare]
MARLKSIMNIQPNIFMLRYFRTSGSYLLIIFLILYVAYFTSEVCLRIQNINKYERLQSYDIEIKDLTTETFKFPERYSKCEEKSQYIKRCSQRNN